MEQIRESQIIPTRVVQPNPYAAPPRDYRLHTDGADALAHVKPIIQETVVPGNSGNSGTITPPNINYGDVINDAAQRPAVPHIISIKQQVVNIHDDGTITIDVILNVEDIAGVTEYDIRVAKDAGNL